MYLSATSSDINIYWIIVSEWWSVWLPLFTEVLHFNLECNMFLFLFRKHENSPIMLYLRQNSDTFVSRRLSWYHLWNDILSSVFDLPICPPDAPVIRWHDHDPVTWEIMLIIPPLRCSVSRARPWASWHHFSSGYLRSVQHVRCPVYSPDTSH